MRIVKHRGKWAVSGTIGGKRGRWSTGLAAVSENYPAAERAAQDLERQLARPAGNKVGEIFPAYLDDRNALRRDRQETSWLALAPFFSILTANQIDRETCRKYTKKRRKDGVKDGTIRKELSDCRAAVNWHDPNNSATWDLPAQPEPRDRWLTRKEFAKLLKAAEPTYHLWLFLHLAIATAGRKEAILTLTWDQVMFDRNQIWLGTKANGKKRATIPMTNRLRTVLEEAKQAAIGETVIEWGGKPIKSIKRALRKAVERAGLEDVSAHVIRHTSAVWMANDGVDLWQISTWLGHSDIRVTQRVYAKHQPEFLRGAASSLEV